MRVKGSGIAQGLANAWPWAVHNLQIPDPGTEKVGKCPSVARGKGEGGLGTAGIDLCISNNNSEGYENVTKKVNSRRFKPYISGAPPARKARAWTEPHS